MEEGKMQKNIQKVQLKEEKGNIPILIQCYDI